MHLLDERLRVLDRRADDHAVSEIEDVPCAGAVGQLEHARDASLLLAQRQEEGGGIEVSLQRDGRPDAAARLVEGDAPVDTDDVRAGCRELGEQLAGLYAEDDHGLRILRVALQAGDHARDVGRAKFRVVLRPESAGPGIEDLQRVRAGGELRVQVRDERVGDLAEQRVRQPLVGEEEGLRALEAP